MVPYNFLNVISVDSLQIFRGESHCHYVGFNIFADKLKKSDKSFFLKHLLNNSLVTHQTLLTVKAQGNILTSTSLRLKQITYFSFSCHQYLFLFLFYRIVLIWLSYSVSVWSLGQHVCRFSPAIAHLSIFGNLQNHPVSLKIYASLLTANSTQYQTLKAEDFPCNCI